MERIEFWRNELQGARLYDGRAKTISVGYVRHWKPTVAHRFQRRVRGVCVRVAVGDLPTRRPRAKDSNTGTTSRRHNAVRAKGGRRPRHDGVELHYAPSEDGVRTHWFGQVSAWRAGAYGTCRRTRRSAAGSDWTEVLGATGCRFCQDGSASSDADRSQRELQVDRRIALGGTTVGASDTGHRGCRPRRRCL
jgi:hypothetical protein